MDPRLLSYYNKELRHLRELGGEFAEEFPKVAGRLGLNGIECADPYVERLLEGFGFLAARVQLKIDAEFPKFTQHLLETVYPDYLAPTPSMAIAAFQPKESAGALSGGITIPRHTALRSRPGSDEMGACEYRTAHEVTLWPIAVTEASYFTHPRDVLTLGFPGAGRVRAGIRVRLRSTGNVPFDRLGIDRLTFHFHGRTDVAMQLYEAILGHGVGVVLTPPGTKSPWSEFLDPCRVRPVGFENAESLLPGHPRVFQGHRLLREYFAFPARFLFAEVSQLGRAVRRCPGNELDVIFLLDRSEESLSQSVDASNFVLHATPVVNLFPRRADRIHLRASEVEYHVVPDRTRALDFEVFHVRKVVGHGASTDSTREFLPFYSSRDLSVPDEGSAYFTVRRERRRLSGRQKQRGPRSSYVGSETFLSLVDSREAPYGDDLRQLSVQTLCTNRDLALQMPVGTGKTDFSVESGAPLASIRCLTGPTPPRASHAEGDPTWRLISHLSLNYVSLGDGESDRGLRALRDLLALYGDTGSPATRKQIEGVRELRTAGVMRRLDRPGPIAFGRGVEVTVACDDSSFEGGSVFLLGAVLERFFGKYVSINSFTETVIRTDQRGEVMRWPARTGRGPLL